MFADDTNLTTASSNKEELQRRLNFDLELNMHNWLLANKLILNKDKTEYMIIDSHQEKSLLLGLVLTTFVKITALMLLWNINVLGSIDIFHLKKHFYHQKLEAR
jgi:hypothetical protein